MTVGERTELAWQAYRLAVVAARSVSTPATWARLLRAAQYLRDAIEGSERERGRRTLHR